MAMEEPLKVLDEQLGGFGRFQKRVFFLACLPPIMTGLSVVNHVFLSLNVPYRCAIPTCESVEDISINNFNAEFLNFTTPLDESKQKWSSCHRYSTNSSERNDSLCSAEDFDPSTTQECSKWVYDISEFTSTLVTEFDLTCDNAWMKSLGGSIFMFGMPFGAIFLGCLADIIGRKKGLVVSLSVLFCGEFGACLSINYYMFLVMKFISGAGCIATFQTSIIIALEVVSTEYRTFCGMFIKIPFALGETSIAGFAYFIREWRWLQFALSIPPFLLLANWWIMPESIRWLLSKRKYNKAKRLIREAARMNDVIVSPEVINTLTFDGIQIYQSSSNDTRRMSPLDLFRSPRVRNRTFVLIFSWISITHNFYGLSLNSANFGGNVFITFIAIMFIEIPSYVIAYLILDKLGRKGTLVLLLLIGGSACFLAAMINEAYGLMVIILSIVGKFCTAAAFAVIYIYTIEIFPTQYRSMGLGICSMSARLGGIIAPFTAGIGIYYNALPLIIFGVLSILCGSVLLILPETLGSELPQTLEESEKYGADQSLFFFTCCPQLAKKMESRKEKKNFNRMGSI